MQQSRLKGKDLERVLILKDMLLKSSMIDNVNSLTLCGYGDPFASRPHLEFLRSLDVRRFRNLRIKLLTNGLLRLIPLKPVPLHVDLAGQPVKPAFGT